MAVKLSTLLLAAVASAAPLVSHSQGPCISADFTLAMRVDAVYVSLNAIDSGTPGVLSIVGERESAYPGTPGTGLRHRYCDTTLIANIYHSKSERYIRQRIAELQDRRH